MWRASLRFGSHTRRVWEPNPAFRTRASAALTPPTIPELFVTTPPTLGGAGMKARGEGGSRTLPPQPGGQPADASGSGSSPSRGLQGLCYLRLVRLGSVFSSNTRRGGKECGRAAQPRAGDTDPQGPPPVTAEVRCCWRPREVRSPAPHLSLTRE